MAERTQVRVFDTTLRDGEQAPGFSMTPAEKVRLAHQIDALGADIIEAGFPIASRGDFEAVRAVAAEVRRPIIAGLARAVPGDVERAWAALSGAARPRIHVFLATSPIHLAHKLRMTPDQALRQAVEAVRLARGHAADVEFSAEDATRSDVGFVCEVAAAVVEAGATTVNLPDTVGYAWPEDIRALFTAVGRVVGDRAVLSAHCHDDLGLATANTLAAIEAGARQFECTVNGIGERAGNAALEEIVMALAVRGERLGVETAIRREAIYPTSRLLSEIVHVPVPPNKAIVGDNAFAHEAGIHQDGMLKHPLTYEIMRPEDVGAPPTRLVIGKHSGTRGLDGRCRALGYRLGPDALDRAYRRLIALADERKTLTDDDVIAVAREEAAPPPAAGLAAPVACGARAWN